MQLLSNEVNKMNPVFILLVLIGGFLLWILLSALYKPIGKVSEKLADDAKKAMFEENEKEKET